jgi:hypothetical protein
MRQDINLKEIERRAWRSTFQDGLWDIYLGLLLLAMAIGAWMSDIGASKSLSYGIYAGLMGLAMLVLWAGKRFITIPRMGRVKFGPKAKARKKKARLLLTVSVVVGLLLFLFIWLAVMGGRSPGLSLRLIAPLVWTVNVLIVFGLGGYFLDFKRLYLIGLMYALAVPLNEALRALSGLDLSLLAFGLPALVILGTGLVVFVRFVRHYPLPSERDVNGEVDPNA